MSIARQFGQPPHIVALWPPEWLAVCQTALAAENGAAGERERSITRRQKAANMSGRR